MPPTLPHPETSTLWQNLEWRTVVPTIRDQKTSPVIFEDAPKAAGLYRVTVHCSDFWSAQKADSVAVSATKSIEDPSLIPGRWDPPVVLTIGKTTQLHQRLAQHLGNNKHNNRLLRRLRHLFPRLDDSAIRNACARHMTFEIVEEPDWRERFLLELYGTAKQQSLLDFTAEH